MATSHRPSIDRSYGNHERQSRAIGRFSGRFFPSRRLERISELTESGSPRLIAGLTGSPAITNDSTNKLAARTSTPRQQVQPTPVQPTPVPPPTHVIGAVVFTIRTGRTCRRGALAGAACLSVRLHLLARRAWGLRNTSKEGPGSARLPPLPARFRFFPNRRLHRIGELAGGDHAFRPDSRRSRPPSTRVDAIYFRSARDQPRSSVRFRSATTMPGRGSSFSSRISG
jgi:hypothetical protein